MEFLIQSFNYGVDSLGNKEATAQILIDNVNEDVFKEIHVGGILKTSSFFLKKLDEIIKDGKSMLVLNARSKDPDKKEIAKKLLELFK